MKKLFLFFSVVVLLFNYACHKPDEKKAREGFVPIYLSKHDAYDIKYLSPRAVEVPGKIYVKDSMIYLVEQEEGIHIISNSDPSDPQITGFLKIGGIKNMSIKSHVLYCENFTDIVAVDIANIQNPVVTKRIEDINPIKNIMAPEEDGWFECADTSKGYVIGWRKQTVYDPKCYKGINPEIE